MWRMGKTLIPLWFHVERKLNLLGGCIKTFIQAIAHCSWVIVYSRGIYTGSWVEGVGSTDVLFGMHSVLKN